MTDGFKTTAAVLTPLLRQPREHAVVLDVSSCPGDQEWSCHCIAGRTVHPNLSFATGIMRQWVVSEIPRGRKVELPVQLPPDAKTFKLTLPVGESTPSGVFAISFYDSPVPCPTEFPPTSEGVPSKSSETEMLPWCTAWIPTAAATFGTPPRSCLLLAVIHGVEYMRLTIHSTRPLGTLYKFTDYMVPRMLGLDDLDPRALSMARKGSDSAASGMRLAILAVKRAVDTAPHADGCGQGGIKYGCVPSSIAELGALLQRSAALTSAVRALQTTPPAPLDALDQHRFNMQLSAAVSVAVDHHLPELEPAARSRVKNALQRQLRSVVAPVADSHADYNLAIANAFHSVGRMCAICCSAWWSLSGSLPEKPKLLPPSNSWNIHVYSDYASAYMNWDYFSLGFRSSDGADLIEIRQRLEAALSRVNALCKVVDSASPDATTGMLVEDQSSSGPWPGFLRGSGFIPPRGLALVTTLALCVTMLHRETLWVHARLFPTFFHLITSPKECQHQMPSGVTSSAVKPPMVRACDGTSPISAATSHVATPLDSAEFIPTAMSCQSQEPQDADCTATSPFARSLDTTENATSTSFQAPEPHQNADDGTSELHGGQRRASASISTTSSPLDDSEALLREHYSEIAAVPAIAAETTTPISSSESPEAALAEHDTSNAHGMNVFFSEESCQDTISNDSTDKSNNVLVFENRSSVAHQDHKSSELNDHPGSVAVLGEDDLARALREIEILRQRANDSEKALAEEMRLKDIAINTVLREKDEMSRELDAIRARLSRERELAKTELAKARTEAKFAKGRAVASEVEVARLRREADEALKASELARATGDTLQMRIKAASAALGDALAVFADVEQVKLPRSVLADALASQMVCADTRETGPGPIGTCVVAVASTHKVVIETLRAERDSVAAHAASLETELAEAKRHVQLAFKALNAPASMKKAACATTAGALRTTGSTADAASILPQLEALRAEISAHKAAAASSSAALAATTSAFNATRDELAHYVGLSKNAKAAIDYAETRAAQAEQTAMTARRSEAETQRIADTARQRLQSMAQERDDALESVRRITAVAAAHELRCSELQVATCEVCDMCVRQQEELAAARREAEASRNMSGSGVSSPAEVGRMVEMALQHQQQLAASRVLVATLEARIAALQAQLSAQTRRCVCLQVAVQELQPQFDESDVAAQSVLSVLDEFSGDY